MFAFGVKCSEHKNVHDYLGPCAEKFSVQVFYSGEILQYQVLCFLALCM
jgi:hypothetical protein